MEQQVLINRRVLMVMLSRLADGGIGGIPNPDDPDDDGPYGPWGPWGPWAKATLQTRYAVALANEIVRMTVGLQQVIEFLPERDLQKQFSGAVTGSLAMVVDDWCGTRWPRWPFPWPKPPRLAERPDSIDLMAAGLQFQIAAEQLPDGELRDFLAAGGARMIEQGLAGG